MNYNHPRNSFNDSRNSRDLPFKRGRDNRSPSPMRGDFGQDNRGRSPYGRNNYSNPRYNSSNQNRGQYQRSYSNSSYSRDYHQQNYSRNRNEYQNSQNSHSWKYQEKEASDFTPSLNRPIPKWLQSFLDPKSNISEIKSTVECMLSE